MEFRDGEDMNVLRAKREYLKKVDANHCVTLPDFRNRHFKRSKEKFKSMLK